MRRATFSVTLGAVLMLLPNLASACTVCMGDPNSKEAGAVNGAIFLMLGFIFSVLLALGSFGVCLMRRANHPLT
jgi:hypothetical protein